MARPRPDRVFLVIAATAAFVSALVFTIAPVYRFRTAGLDNLQLVLVGTVMEAAVFVFEIPTGVVADRWSRKWSVIIGHAGIGVGLLIEADVLVVRRRARRARRCGASPTRSRAGRRSPGWPASSATRTGAVLRTLFLRASRFGSIGCARRRAAVVRRSASTWRCGRR